MSRVHAHVCERLQISRVPPTNSFRQSRARCKIYIYIRAREERAVPPLFSPPSLLPARVSVDFRHYTLRLVSSQRPVRAVLRVHTDYVSIYVYVRPSRALGSRASHVLPITDVKRIKLTSSAVVSEDDNYAAVRDIVRDCREDANLSRLMPVMVVVKRHA